MWPWLKRWRDWAMHDLWPMVRLGSRSQALHFSYEKAGLLVPDQPIPWNADAVQVEGTVRLPSGRNKIDFRLALPGQEPIQVDTLRRGEGGDNHYHLTFRLPAPKRTVTAEILCRSTSLGRLALPHLSQEQFLDGLRVQMPAVFVRLGEQSVACQTYVSTQSRGLMAGAVLSSPTSLLPLHDLGVQVEFRSERRGSICTATAPLTSSQLIGRQALVNAIPKKFPRRIGAARATWKVGDRVLAQTAFRAISQRTFQRSLRICDTRFLVQTGNTALALQRRLPPVQPADRVGPCFLVASREAGMAGLCALHVHALVSGAVQPPLLHEQLVLITDGPTLVAPGTLPMRDLDQVTGFELRLKEQVLGTLMLSPAPAAKFNSEGSFQAPEEFLWTSAAEDELNLRLNKLLAGGGAKGE